jgi:hypothetical protein
MAWGDIVTRTGCRRRSVTPPANGICHVVDANEPNLERQRRRQRSDLRSDAHKCIGNEWVGDLKDGNDQAPVT